MAVEIGRKYVIHEKRGENMGLFSRHKSIGSHKALEVVNDKKIKANIDEALRKKECKILFENEDIQYIQYNGGYYLRREKKNKNKLIYLGMANRLACYFNGKIISPNSILSLDSQPSMEIIDCVTGERGKVDIIGKREVLGIDVSQCRDTVVSIKSDNQAVTLILRREKSYDPKFSAIPYNEDFEYAVKLVLQNDHLTTTPVTPASITKRGPWAKPKFVLPPDELTEADLALFLDQSTESDSKNHASESGKYWLAGDGSVKCPGDSCKKECTTECPIYLQTLALRKLMINDFWEAEKLLKKAVEIEPSFADAWNNLGSCYGQMGNHQKAYDAYEKSFNLSIKPNPLFGLAVAAKNLKRYNVSEDFIRAYEMTFGSDNRINALKAEIKNR